MKVISIVFLVLTFQLLYSQSDGAYITFDETKYNFGYVYEADGYLIISFNYRNVGKKPLQINRIIATGFHVQEYTRDSILNNRSGVIKLRLAPFKKAGHFNKKIRVFSNAENSPTELGVQGKILHGSYTGSFRHQVGDLSLKQSQLNFGYIYDGNEIVRFIPVISKSQNILKVKFLDVPEHLDVIPKFDSLLPGQNSMIEVKYNTKKINDWDFVINRLRVEVHSEHKVVGNLSVSANIREDFSKLSAEEKSVRPKVSIPIQIFNFDTINKNQHASYDFLIKNNGERDLDIRAVKPTCGCTAVLPVNSSIPPGDSTYIEVAFDSKGYSGHNKKGVTVITNDPTNYKQFLWVTGFVDP